MPAQFNLGGGPELLALLDQLPKKLVGKVARGGARAAAVVLQKEAKAKIERKSGKAAKSLKVSSRLDGEIASAKVSMKGPHAYIGIFLEYGVEQHEITRKGLTADGGGRRSLKIGDDFVGAKVTHPGFGEMPFMRVALDTKGSEAVNAMGEYFATRISWNTLQAPALQVEEDEE